ncbi:sulfurtransferase complex subunit TusB [Pseudomonas sp.]|uniref:sulfurtransferase complex subunit TusB n=1 Tax=Pseudomonas sp. TaxID=306 RepID=UPI0028AC3D16|nr:sulfurtransferase complex subunit TusB [Pseudomonas sp.]
MATLHVIAHSPFGDDRLESCLRLLDINDAVLLCADAVNALRMGSATAAQLNAAGLDGRLFALEEDMTARAISSNLAQTIDYPTFVELSLRYDKVNSWL